MTRDLTRRAAALLLTVAVAVNLALGFHGLRHGLPYVFHADSEQVGQAASLLRNGWFADHAPYPPALVFVYAGAARVAWELETRGLVGDGEARGGWPAFVERFGEPTLQHTIGRVVSVLAGALLVLGTWRLGRVMFSRRVSLLAAAAIAVDPVLVITGHQVRPHVPAAAALVLAAPLVLRLVQRAATRDGAAVRSLATSALMAGAAVGIATSVLQLAVLLAAAGAGLLLLLVRPLRRAAALTLAFLAGTAATAMAIDTLLRATGTVRPVLAQRAQEDVGTLALPGNMLELGLWRRFPVSCVDWLAAAPLLFAGLFVFAVLCWRGRQSWRALLIYGALPLAVLAVMQTIFGGQVRYLVEVSPFVAVLAAAACLSLRPPALGAALAVLLVAQPLAGSLRFEALLGTLNSRVGLDALVAQVNGSGEPLVIAVQDRLCLEGQGWWPGQIAFPDSENLALRERQLAAPGKALREAGAVIYAREPGVTQALGALGDEPLRRLGLQLYGTIHAGPPGRLDLPDIPDRLVTDLWSATRTGPTIELWVASAEADARLRRIAAPAALDAWTADPASAGAPSAARRENELASGMLHDIRCDVDGDGAPESVAANMDAAHLAQLLALPADRWRDAGGSEDGAPRLTARGALVGREPVLLLLTGAAPQARVTLIASTREVRKRCARGLLVPAPDLVVHGLATGGSGALALTVPWPRGLPIGLSLFVQCWVAGPSARASVATNALVATTPG